MKIAFWSNVRGQCGTTLNLTSVALVHALYENQKVILLENHDHLMNIDNCLTKVDSEVRDGFYGYNYCSLEYLMQIIKKVSTENEFAWIKKCARTYAGESVFYLPHSYIKDREILAYHFDKGLTYLLHRLEHYFGAVYIDTFATGDGSTRSIIENADVVVVNLSQNQNIISHFFRNFSNLRNKAIFVLGAYYPGMFNNIHEIKRRYQIPDERIFAIPYCMEAAEAASEGTLTSFISRNLYEPSVNNRDFINSVINTCEGIINYASVSSKSDFCGLTLM